jgi:hypothetical protein
LTFNNGLENTVINTILYYSSILKKSALEIAQHYVEAADMALVKIKKVPQIPMVFFPMGTFP